MRLEPDEIAALAKALAPLVADELEHRLSERPEWAKSIGEAASFARVEVHQVRKAIASGKLPALKIGNSIRIKRSHLSKAWPKDQQLDGDDGA